MCFIHIPRFVVMIIVERLALLSPVLLQDPRYPPVLKVLSIVQCCVVIGVSDGSYTSFTAYHHYPSP